MDDFIQGTSADLIEQDLWQAFDDLSDNLITVDIYFKERERSVEPNIRVDPLHIGDILDLLRTLYESATEGGKLEGQFSRDRFWEKINKMRDIMLQDDSNSEDD